MDDLKIVLYLVVTVLWLFLNNYKKIQKQARERKLAMPQQDTAAPEAEFNTSPAPAKSENKSMKEIRKELQMKDLKGRHSAKSKKDTAFKFQGHRDDPNKYQEIIIREGGDFLASEKVNFKIAPAKEDYENHLLEEINETDWKKAVVLSEILNRPYV